MRQTIHRADLNGRPLCGASSGLISASGAVQAITCPTCQPATPGRFEQMLSIAKAAAHGSGRTIWLFLQEGAASYNCTAEREILDERKLLELHKVYPNGDAYRVAEIPS